MRIGEHRSALQLRPDLAAPRECERFEKALPRSTAIAFLGIHLLALARERILERNERQVEPVVGPILALGELAILFNAGFRNYLGVLVGYARAVFLLSGGGLPPVAQIALGVEFSTPGRRSRE